MSSFLSSILVSYSSLQYAQHRQSKVKLLQSLHRPPSPQVSRSSSLRSSSSSSGALGTDTGEHDESDHCIHSGSEEWRDSGWRESRIESGKKVALECVVLQQLLFMLRQEFMKSSSVSSASPVCWSQGNELYDIKSASASAGRGVSSNSEFIENGR